MLELNLSTGVLRGLALLTSPRAGAKDPNPNSAIHIRYIDEFSIRLAVTNGHDTAYLRLYVEEGGRLSAMYWPEEERERTISILINAQALGALAKMGQRIIVCVSNVYAKIRSEGEGGVTAIEAPRICGRQISLFDDMEAVAPATLEDLTPRGQVVIDPKFTHRAYSVAKLVGAVELNNMVLAQIGTTYGVSFGSDQSFWLFSPMASTKAPMHGGLPPYWVTGQSNDLPPVADGLEEAWEHVAEIEDAYAEDGQQSLDLDDEHAPSTVDAGAMRPLEWLLSYDDEDRTIYEAVSAARNGDDAFTHRIRKDSPGVFVIRSDGELMMSGDEHLTFTVLEEAQAYCQRSEDDMILELGTVANTGDYDVPPMDEYTETYTNA